MTSPLTLIAGPTALAHLRRHGLRADDVRVVVAASGGPKWFILKALDQYLYGDFFRDRSQPLHTLGSSAGAWQLACLACPDPANAIQRLADLYSRETYSARPSAQEVTAKARRLVQQVLGPDGARHLAEHPIVRTHILATRCRGLLAREAHGLQLSGLALAATANAFSRKALRLFFERLVLHAGTQSFFRFHDQPTRTVPLTAANVEDALMATAAIPLVLSGVTRLQGAPPGTYRDGGILDYHFDLPLLPPGEGLVLYPHFSQRVVPGWFDKSLSWRRPDPRHYDNVVLLTPSRDLVSSLPFGKISDREDFRRLDDRQRLAAWTTVLQTGERLAEACAELVASGRGIESIQPFPAA